MKQRLLILIYLLCCWEYTQQNKNVFLLNIQLEWKHKKRKEKKYFGFIHNQTQTNKQKMSYFLFVCYCLFKNHRKIYKRISTYDGEMIWKQNNQTKLNNLALISIK